LNIDPSPKMGTTTTLSTPSFSQPHIICKTGKMLQDLVGWQIEQGTKATKENAAAYLQQLQLETSKAEEENP